MKHKIIFLSIAVLCCTMVTNAQHYYWRDSSIKYKSIVMTAYKSTDSNMKKKWVDYTETDLYNQHGNQTSIIRVNRSGKKLEETKFVYNEKGQLVHFARYDSLGKMESSSDDEYDSRGRLSKEVDMQKRYRITYALQDSDKLIGYTNHYQYDFKDNLLETITDSDNVPISSTAVVYDDQEREISSVDKRHGKVESQTTTVYHPDSSYDETYEYFYTSYGGASCSPSSDKTTTKYDKDANELSSEAVSIANGVTTTTTTIYTYTYDKGNMTSMVEVTTEASEDHESKSKETWTYKYDDSGNRIEEVEKGYNGSSLNRYTYNKKNKQLTEVTYGSCVDKPVSMTTYTYYPNDTVLKEYTYASYEYPTKTTTRYNEDGEITEEITADYEGMYEYRVYKYEYWKKK